MDKRYVPPENEAPDDYAPQIVQLVFAGPSRPSLSAVTSLLYDLELAHSLSTLLSQEKDETQRLVMPYFFYRSGHQLAEKREALVSRLTKASPLTIELVVAGIGGIWVLIQIIEKIATWEQVRQRLTLENRKLKYEAEIKRLELQEKYDARIKQRQAEQIQQELVTRLNRSDFRLTDLAYRRQSDTDA